MRVGRVLRVWLRYDIPLWMVRLVTDWWPDVSPCVRFRGRLAKPFIARCGRNFAIGRDVTLLAADRLTVGPDVYLAKGTWLNALGGVEIEAEVMVGPYCVISSTNHGFRDGRAALITNNCAIRRAQVVRERPSQTGDPPSVLYLGRLSREKGLPVLLDAFAQVLRRMRARLDVYGLGLMREELEAQALSLGIRDSVVFHGWVPPGAPFFAALKGGDVFVLPSLSEGLPSVIPEAMSQGLPIIASRVGGIPDILQNGEAGILVPPGDSAALADAICRLLIDQSLRKRLIRRSMEQALESCMEEQAGKFFSEIASLMERHFSSGKGQALGFRSHA